MFAVGVASIVVVSLLPYPLVYGAFAVSDKIEHAAAYAVVALLGAIGFGGWRRQAMLGAGLIALGGTLELAQTLVPGRLADLADALANGVGVIAGVAAGRLISLALEKRRVAARAA